jgi:hypothetical protein
VGGSATGGSVVSSALSLLLYDKVLCVSSWASLLGTDSLATYAQVFSDQVQAKAWNNAIFFLLNLLYAQWATFHAQ